MYFAVPVDRSEFVKLYCYVNILVSLQVFLVPLCVFLVNFTYLVASISC